MRIKTFFNREKRLIAVSGVMFALFLVGLTSSFFSATRVAAQATGVELYGWAWGVNTGWVSFNSKDCDTDANGVSDGAGSCPVIGTPIPSYSVTLLPGNQLVGYAWTSTLGWVRFSGASAFPSGPGTTPANATYDPGTRTISGWAKMCNPGIVHLNDCATPFNSVSFETRTDVPVAAGFNAKDVLADKDLNGDGFNDAVLVNAAQGVRVFLNNGSGGYSASTLYDVHDTADASTDQIAGAAIGSVNADGLRDIVVAYRTGLAAAPVTRFAFLLNNSASPGTFIRGTDYTVPTAIRALRIDFATSDYTRQKDDLILVGTTGAGNVSVTSYLNNGAGTFASGGAGYTNPSNLSGSQFGGAVFADFNDDTLDDVAIAYKSINTVRIIENGGGVFSLNSNSNAVADSTVGLQPADIALGDFDGDGALDLVTLNSYVSGGPANPGYGTVSYLRNRDNGNSRFESKVDTRITYSIASGIRSAHFNQDTLADLAILRSSAARGEVIPLLSSGRGIFYEKRSGVAPTPSLFGFGIGDVNNDSRPDLFSSNSDNTFSIYRNSTIAPAWDGWLSLKGTGYGVRVNAISELEGYAWGGDGIGWLSFNCNEGGIGGTNICGTSRYRVTLFGPFNYDMNDSPDVSLPIGGTVTIPVTARYRTTVGNTSDIVITPQNLGTGLIVDTSGGLPVCRPIANGTDPNYTVCSGNLVLRAQANATVGDHLITLSGDPAPSNTPPTVRVTVYPTLPAYDIEISPSNIDITVGGQPQSVSIVARNFAQPISPLTPMPVFNITNPDPTKYSVSQLSGIPCIPNAPRTECVARVSISPIDRVQNSLLNVAGSPSGRTAPNFRINVFAPAPTVQFWAVPVRQGPPPPPPAACANGLDDDSDTFVDYPNDPGCIGTSDDDETNAPAAPPIAICSNGLDDDSDGLIDYPNDPGCLDSSYSSEANTATPVICSNGLDDDSDGLIDYPNDPGCVSAADTSELNPVTAPLCSNGLDDDGDSFIDYPNDSGCTSASDNNEANPAAPLQCSDGADNDIDGYFDYPNDLGCTSASDNDETNAGGIAPPPPLQGALTINSTLATANEDKAGVQSVFTTGSGVMYTHPYDWSWTITLTSSVPRTITTMNVLLGSFDVWSTSDARYYPLVLFSGATQLNTSYNQEFSIPAGTTILKGYGQIEYYQEFAGGYLSMRFSDGSVVSVPIPASSIVPPTAVTPPPPPAVTPPPVVPPPPGATPPPVAPPPPSASVGVAAVLVAADTDNVTSTLLSPGEANDWHWSVVLTEAAGKTIQEMSIIDPFYVRWSSAGFSVGTRPLAVFKEGVQMNLVEGQTIGPVVGSPASFDAYGEPTVLSFTGGATIYVTFTDGSSASAVIDGSSIVPTPKGTPPPAPPPVVPPPATTPPPVVVAGDSLNGWILSADKDYASANNFYPGPGAAYGQVFEDWEVNAMLTLGSQKTISSVTLVHDNLSETWSTANPVQHPLVIFRDFFQDNYDYGQTIGPLAAGTYDLHLFAQIESTSFIGGGLTIAFTDGTSITARIEASPIPPISLATRPSPARSPFAFFDSNIFKRFSLAQVVNTFVEDVTMGYIQANTLYIPNNTRICLHWQTTDAVSCTALNGTSFWSGSSNRPTSGTLCQDETGSATNPTVSGPLANSVNIFGLQCRNADGYISSQQTIVHSSPPRVVLRVGGAGNVVRVPTGTKARLTWQIFFGNQTCIREDGDAAWQLLNTTDPLIANGVITIGSYDTNQL